VIIVVIWLFGMDSFFMCASRRACRLKRADSEGLYVETMERRNCFHGHSARYRLIDGPVGVASREHVHSPYSGGGPCIPEPAGHMADHMADKDGEARVRIRSSADIMAARQQGRALASRGGFSSSDLSIIASAISEVAQNIVQYANSGEIIITLINNTTKKGVEIVAADQGPGIADVSRVMRDGYSTGKGLGIGLPGAKRLMDEFEIASEVGKGTTVRMKKWVT